MAPQKELPTQLPKQRIFELIQAQECICTFSGHSRLQRDLGNDVQKMVLKTLMIDGQPHYQLNSYTAKQHFTSNAKRSKEQLDGMLDAIMAQHFMQVHIQTPEADHYFRLTQSGLSAKKTAPSRSYWDTEVHDKQKAYAVTPQNSITLLQELGICNEKGVILASMQAKYRQINHFLSLALPLEVWKADTIRVVDCGCGKAYLSLALYHYVQNIVGKEIYLTGIDSNDSVIDFCQRTTAKLGYHKAEFLCQPIAEYAPTGEIDVLIALHACDTATDDALALGIKAQAKAILAAPCCHHYVNEKLRAANAPELIAPLLRDGIARERFADLLTDTMRRDILRASGYTAELMEFVAPEHTMKNILLRAERATIPDALREELRTQLRAEREQWKAAPRLAEDVGI